MAFPAVLSSIILVSNILIVTGRPNGAYFSVPCPFTNPCEPYNSPACQQYQQPQPYQVDTKSWSAQGQGPGYTSPFSVTIKYDAQNEYPGYPNYHNSRRCDQMSMDSPSASFSSSPPYNPRRYEPMDNPNPSFAPPPQYETPNEQSAPKRGILTSLFSLPGAVADSMLSGEISL